MITTLKNGKRVNVSDTEVLNLMHKYKISYHDAVQLWLEDNDYISNPIVEELEEKAKKNKISREARAEKPVSERKTREKKENPLKKEIIKKICAVFGDELWDLSYNIEELSVRNNEKYIDLTIDGREFTINLVEHRERKPV